MNRFLLAAIVLMAAVLGAINYAWSGFHRQFQDRAPIASERKKAPDVSTPALPPVVSIAVAPVHQSPYVQSYGSARDLWDFANKALANGRVPELYEAVRASRECVGMFAHREGLGSQLSGGQGTYSGGVSPERQLAFLEIEGRCSGFTRAGFDASRQLSRKLSGELMAKGGPAYGPDAMNGDPSDAKSALKVLLASESPLAIENALVGPASDYWEHANGVTDRTDPKDYLMGTAVELATCDLGRDCSKEGLPALMMCALGNQCGDSLWANWKNEFSEGDIRIIEDYKKKLVAAVQARDWIALGLVKP